MVKFFGCPLSLIPTFERNLRLQLAQEKNKEREKGKERRGRWWGGKGEKKGRRGK